FEFRHGSLSRVSGHRLLGGELRRDPGALALRTAKRLLGPGKALTDVPDRAVRDGLVVFDLRHHLVEAGREASKKAWRTHVGARPRGATTLQSKGRTEP